MTTTQKGIYLGDSQWATKDGNLLATKQVGKRFLNKEFTVDRGSDATYVDRDGLIKQFSTPLTNLVQNGDFEELGDELNDLTWSAFGGWSILDGVASNDGSGSTITNEILEIGKTYKITVQLSTYTSGDFSVFLGNGTESSQFNGTNEFTFYGVCSGDVYARVKSINGIGSINIQNISVKEVDPNSDWEVEGYASRVVGTYQGRSNVLKVNILNDATASRIRQPFTYVNGTTYKITVNVYLESGSFRVDSSDSFVSGNFVQTNVESSWQTLTAYFTAQSSGSNYIWLRSSTEVAEFYVDNISIQDITPIDDKPRIDFTNDTEGHLLLEPQSQNLVTYSEDFSEWTNTASETTDTPNAATSPSGESNATKLQEANSSNSFHRLSKTISLSSATNYSLSIFAKKGTLSNMQLILLNTADSKLISKVFDLENGTLGETLTSGAGESLTNSKIEDIGNGWYRCSIVGQLSTAPNTFRINLADASTGNTTSNGMVKYTGDGNGNIYIYGAQLEELSYATSYIPTAGSLVTRTAETCTGAGDVDDFDSTAGILYAEIAMLSEDDKASNNQLFISDGTANQRVGIFTESAGDVRVQIKDSDETPGSRNLTALEQSQSGVDTAAFNKIAIQYKSGENKLFVNGSRITDTNFDSMVFNFSSLDNLEFGSGANSNYFRGKCKAIKVIKGAVVEDTESPEYLTTQTFHKTFNALATANGYTII